MSEPVVMGKRIAELREQVSLAALIGSYIALQGSHDFFIGKCPFHQDDDLAFEVHDGGQFFNCATCGAHGGHLAFLIKHLSFSFGEALAEMEKLAGLKDPKIVSIHESRAKRTGLANKKFNLPGKVSVSYDDIEPFVVTGLDRPDDHVLRAILLDWIGFVTHMDEMFGEDDSPDAS